jgi:hypothetical protein
MFSSSISCPMPALTFQYIILLHVVQYQVNNSNMHHGFVCVSTTIQITKSFTSAWK